MSVRIRSVIGLALSAALAAGCFPAARPAGNPYSSSPRPSPLSGTSWVLDSATNVLAAAQAAPAATTASTNGGAQPAVSPAAAPNPIQAAWLLPERGSRPTLDFSADRNAASGSTGCNRYFGDFSVGPTDLWFGSLATTKMMCFDTLAVQEITYLDALSKVNGYSNNGTALTLTTSDGRQLTFTPLSTSVSTQAASYRYVCDDGLHFTANYDPAAQSAALQFSSGASDTLKQDVSGSGTLYSSQHHRLHAKGNEALLDTLYDGVTHHCVAPLSPQG